MGKQRLLFGTAGFALAIGMSATPALAQDEAGAENGDIIIVTATRRAQDVQDIPIAVTAVTPVQLQNQGVVEVRDIAQVAPSFSAQTAQNATTTPTLRIRGIGTAGNGLGFESAVGIFVDGAYQSRPGVALSEFVDIERVEILRGPQGTLFGRNTSAGALNITTKRPDLDEFGGFANATYGNMDLLSIQGAVNAPIVKDTLAVRLTGAYRKRDGYVDIVDASGTKIGESGTIDQYLVRGQLGYESEGGVKGRLIVDYSKSENQCCSPVEILASPLETSGLLGQLSGDPRGGQAAPFPGSNPFDTAAAKAALDRRISTANRLPLSRVKQWGITGELEFPLGDNADLILIGSYRDFSSRDSYDADFTGLDVFEVDDQRADIETFTAEARIQGEALDGRLNWVVGGFYSDEQISSDVTSSLGAGFDLLAGAAFGGIFGPAPLELITGASPALTTTNYQFFQSAESWSVFTHNTFELTDGLSVTVGLRYSDESKQGGFTQPANTNPTCFGALAAAATPPGLGELTAPVVGLSCFAFTGPVIPGVPGLPQEFDVPFNDNELIYTGNISYEFAAPVTVYASFTHGYKAGGINLDTTAAIINPLTGVAGNPTFRSETVDAYEVGVKAKFLDDAVTLNVAGFHEAFTDFQILDFDGVQFSSFNVGSAKTTGVEIESVIRPSSELSFNLALTYVDARYPTDCAGGSTSPNVLALCGNSLSNAPDIVALAGVNYVKDFGNYLRGFVSAQARTVSDQRTGTQAVDPATGVLNALDVLDGHTMVNLRAGIGAQDESWGLEVWGVNVTGTDTYDFAFNTLLRTGSRSAFPNEPATYGVTLRTKF